MGVERGGFCNLSNPNDTVTEISFWSLYFSCSACTATGRRFTKYCVENSAVQGWYLRLGKWRHHKLRHMYLDLPVLYSPLIIQVETFTTL